MSSYFVISVMGSDRPGIVEEVSQLVEKGDCNIEDSRMAHLGGEFAMVMLISGQDAADVSERIRSWACEREMTAVTKPTVAPESASVPAAHIDLRLPDRHGIVRRVTHFLAKHGANVENVETDVQPAPFTGTPTFSMHLDISSQGKIDLEELRATLSDMADDEEIQITIGKQI